MISPSEPIVCVIPGDLHLTGPGTDTFRQASLMIDEVNGSIKPDFVQFIGDNVQNATDAQFELFNGLRQRLDVPHLCLVGDHDIERDPSAEAFRRHVGEPYGSLVLRGYRFIRINTQEFRPVGISEHQIHWLLHELEEAGRAGERVVIFQHNYPYQIWEDFQGPGLDAWRAIVHSHRIDLIFCGHTHYWQVANDGQNVAIANRSIGDPEGGPPGYAILYLTNEDLAVTYRVLSDRTPLVLVTHPREKMLATGPRHIVQGPDRIVARIWHEAGVAGVRCRIDDGAWSPMEPSDDGHWSSSMAGDLLTKGIHSLDIHAIGTDRLEASKRIDFIVDPTGRYTAVPGAWPAVTETAFC